LPGIPDNIRLSSQGGYWVGLSLGRSETMDLVAQYPRARNFLAKVKLEYLAYFANVFHCWLNFSARHAR